jgi:hypothetical protein
MPSRITIYHECFGVADNINKKKESRGGFMRSKKKKFLFQSIEYVEFLKPSPSVCRSWKSWTT